MTNSTPITKTSSRFHDLTGQTFGELTVMYRGKDYIAPKSGAHRTMWHCRCSCGKEKDVDATVLKAGKVISCGCSAAKKAHERHYMDLSGHKYGKLTVLSPAPPRYTKAGRAIMQWNCKCDCGNHRIASTNDLRTGDAHSCGCDNKNTLNKEKYVGTTSRAYNGLNMKIIDYTNLDDIKIEFEDGAIIEHSRISHFKNKNVRHPAFSSKLRAKNFHEYKNLKPAFRYHDTQYYYCVTPDGEQTIMTLHEILKKEKHKNDTSH